jgi:hypothetical protein
VNSSVLLRGSAIFSTRQRRCRARARGTEFATSPKNALVDRRAARNARECACAGVARRAFPGLTIFGNLRFFVPFCHFSPCGFSFAARPPATACQNHARARPNRENPKTRQLHKGGPMRPGKFCARAVRVRAGVRPPFRASAARRYFFRHPPARGGGFRIFARFGRARSKRTRTRTRTRTHTQNTQKSPNPGNSKIADAPEKRRRARPNRAPRARTGARVLRAHIGTAQPQRLARARPRFDASSRCAATFWGDKKRTHARTHADTHTHTHTRAHTRPFVFGSKKSKNKNRKNAGKCTPAVEKRRPRAARAWSRASPLRAPPLRRARRPRRRPNRTQLPARRGAAAPGRHRRKRARGTFCAH